MRGIVKVISVEQRFVESKSEVNLVPHVLGLIIYISTIVASAVVYQIPRISFPCTHVQSFILSNFL